MEVREFCYRADNGELWRYDVDRVIVANTARQLAEIWDTIAVIEATKIASFTIVTKDGNVHVIVNANDEAAIHIERVDGSEELYVLRRYEML